MSHPVKGRKMVGVTGFEADTDSAQHAGNEQVAKPVESQTLPQTPLPMSHGVVDQHEAAKTEKMDEGKDGFTAPQLLTDACTELARVVQAWPKLKPSLRDAILTIVQAGL
jgi:hypothetical protein